MSSQRLHLLNRLGEPGNVIACLHSTDSKTHMMVYLETGVSWINTYNMDPEN